MQRKQQPKPARARGFTIVELLIVIVVIGILAAISIVAYNGVQNSARTAQMQSDFRNIKQAIEMYRTENGVYPNCVAGGDGCNFSEIAPRLQMANLPTKTRGGRSEILYVADPLTQRWAVRFYDDKNTRFCKVGDNMLESWWSSAPACW